MGFEFCSLGILPGGTAFARPTKVYCCTDCSPGKRSATGGIFLIIHLAFKCLGDEEHDIG